MKQNIFLTKNNDLLNVMFRGTPCMYNIFTADSFPIYFDRFPHIFYWFPVQEEVLNS